MPSKDELKRMACDEIDRSKGRIIDVVKDILDNPETGFSEQRTSRLVAEKLEEMGVPHRDGLALTGVKGRLEGGAGAGPRVSVIGELDSLVVYEHPHVNPSTGAAHACGHNAQVGYDAWDPHWAALSGGPGRAYRAQLFPSPCPQRSSWRSRNVLP